MRDAQIKAGFSEIKSEFIRKTRTTTPIEQLKLWFSYEDHVLCAHEEGHPKAFVILALRNSAERIWRQILRTEGDGEKLIKQLSTKYEPKQLLNELNHLYARYERAEAAHRKATKGKTLPSTLSRPRPS